MRRYLGSFLVATVALLGVVFGQVGSADAATHTPVVFVHGSTGARTTSPT